jgi:hypothetical protein
VPSESDISERTRARYVRRCRREYDYGEKKWERVCRQVHEGYNHDFYARLAQWSVGTHVKPVIVHYSAKDEGEAPKAKPHSSMPDTNVNICGPQS